MWPLVIALLLLLVTLQPVAALEPVLMKESIGGDANLSTPCLLTGNTNGTAANYRWYNACSGYIWIFTSWIAGEGVGVLYGGAGNEEVAGRNDIKRTITYFRNVVQNYNQTVDVFVDLGDAGGCIVRNIASDLNLDPGLRWNCSEFNVDMPCSDTSVYVIVRTQHDGGAAPTFATDGPFANACDPNPPQRSYYYGINGSTCVPWPGQTDAADNWLQWLILDMSDPCICCDPPNATRGASWGAIKGLFR